MMHSQAYPSLADSRINAAVVRQASEWMVRLWSGNASEEVLAEFGRWRSAHPDHDLAWQRLQAFEAKFDEVPRDVAKHALREPAAQVYASRRRALRALGIGLAVGGSAFLLRGTETWRVATADHSTRTGEIRHIALPDGTQVVLSTSTSIDVRFTAQERLIALLAGEILVTTSHDPHAPHRPFRVRNAHGVVEALGTRFIVRQNETDSRVSVFEGAVRIQPARDGSLAVQIDAGQSALFSSERVESSAGIQASAAAWAEGRLVADDMRLADFVEELSRYRTGILRCDPSAADLRVSGVYSLRDTDRALYNVSLGLPVDVLYLTRYWVTVRAR